jgi:hypothetical protein
MLVGVVYTSGLPKADTMPEVVRKPAVAPGFPLK